MQKLWNDLEYWLGNKVNFSTLDLSYPFIDSTQISISL